MVFPTTDEIVKSYRTHYQAILNLNTGAGSGFKALAGIIDADGSARTAGQEVEPIEGETETPKTLIWTILNAIRRDRMPLFEPVDCARCRRQLLVRSRSRKRWGAAPTIFPDRRVGA